MGPVPVVDPWYGRVIRHRYYAQFARTLGTLMENGVPLLRSLDLVTEIAGNRFLEAKLGEVRRAVIDCATLSAALQQQKLFPDLFTDMMAVGDSGPLLASSVLPTALPSISKRRRVTPTASRREPRSGR